MHSVRADDVSRSDRLSSDVGCHRDLEAASECQRTTAANRVRIRASRARDAGKRSAGRRGRVPEEALGDTALVEAITTAIGVGRQR